MIDHERIAEEYDQALEDNPRLAGSEMVEIIAERMKPDPEQTVDDFKRQEPSLIRAIEAYVSEREPPLEFETAPYVCLRKRELEIEDREPEPG